MSDFRKAIVLTAAWYLALNEPLTLALLLLSLGTALLLLGEWGRER